MMSTKLDLKKELKFLYAPSAKQVSLVEVPPMKFAMVDGEIESKLEPANSPSYHQAIELLYGISYTLKFMSKLRSGDPIDYTVMALEGLWWDKSGKFDIDAKDRWQWTAMIMQPEHISEAMFQEALKELGKKKPELPLERLRFETFEEGLCMQIMHIGPYSAERATIKRMEAFAAENGFQLRGKHHEIYLSDPRRSAPEKLKTVLRQPIQRQGT